MWILSKGTGPKWNKFRAFGLNTSIYYLTREKKCYKVEYTGKLNEEENWEGLPLHVL